LLSNGCSSNKDKHRVDEACEIGLFAGDYNQCIEAIADMILKLSEWSKDTSINVCDMLCMGNIKGRLSKTQWKWDARFHCDLKAPGIIGYATDVNRKLAMESAIQDFIQKAKEAGYLNSEDTTC